MKHIKLIITRAIVVYLLLFTAIWYVPWFHLARAHTIAQMLTRLNPKIDYFQDFVNPHDNFAVHQLNLCVNYHKRIEQLIPTERSEAYQMIAYCYGLLGDSERAEKYYEMSTTVTSGPYYFWPYYNLGIFAFRKGDYSKAVQYFQKALETKEAVNHWIWRHSKVFHDVRVSDPYNLEDHFSEHFMESRKQAYFLLMESKVKLEDYDKLFKAVSLGIKENLGEGDVFYYYGGVGDFYRGNYNEALIFLNLALHLNPDNSDVILYMGKCMQAIGRQDLADRLFKQADYIKQRDGSFMGKRLDPPLRFF